MPSPKSSGIRRTFDLLQTIDATAKPGAIDLSELTGLPRATLRRHLAALRRDFGVQITYVRDPASAGYYAIEDWGVFSRKRFLAHMAEE